MCHNQISLLKQMKPKQSRPAAARGRTSMVEGQNHMAQEVELAFRTFDYVSRKAYNIRFHEVLSESNKRRRSSRVRQISGVVLKLNYSQERKILHPLTGRTEYRWRIDSDKLARKPDNDWELRILEAYPGRAPGETGKGVAPEAKKRNASWSSLCTISSLLRM